MLNNANNVGKSYSFQIFVMLVSENYVSTFSLLNIMIDIFSSKD